MMHNLRMFGHGFSYNYTNRPVYRGANPHKSDFKLSDYEVNTIRQWP